MIAGGELNKKHLTELRKALASMESTAEAPAADLASGEIWRDCCCKKTCS